MSKYDNSEARVPNQALLARIAALEAELDFVLNFLQRENSGECIFQRNSYVDIRLAEARALLKGGVK